MFSNILTTILISICTIKTIFFLPNDSSINVPNRYATHQIFLYYLFLQHWTAWRVFCGLEWWTESRMSLSLSAEDRGIATSLSHILLIATTYKYSSFSVLWLYWLKKVNLGSIKVHLHFWKLVCIIWSYFLKFKKKMYLVCTL